VLCRSLKQKRSGKLYKLFAAAATVSCGDKNFVAARFATRGGICRRISVMLNIYIPCYGCKSN
jgi:hypothetical protein